MEDYYDEEETTGLEDGDAVVNGHVEEGDIPDIPVTKTIKFLNDKLHLA